MQSHLSRHIKISRNNALGCSSNHKCLEKCPHKHVSETIFFRVWFGKHRQENQKRIHLNVLLFDLSFLCAKQTPQFYVGFSYQKGEKGLMALQRVNDKAIGIRSKYIFGVLN